MHAYHIKIISHLQRERQLAEAQRAIGKVKGLEIEGDKKRRSGSRQTEERMRARPNEEHQSKSFANCAVLIADRPIHLNMCMFVLQLHTIRKLTVFIKYILHLVSILRQYSKSQYTYNADY